VEALLVALLLPLLFLPLLGGRGSRGGGGCGGSLLRRRGLGRLWRRVGLLLLLARLVAALSGTGTGSGGGRAGGTVAGGVLPCRRRMRERRHITAPEQQERRRWGPGKRVTGGGRERAREAYGRRRGAAVEAAARARRKCWIWERRGKEEIREAQRDGRLGERRPRGGGHRMQRGFNYIR